MILITRFILLLSVSLYMYPSFAHDTNIATFQIRKVNESNWVYEVMTPLSNLDGSLRKSSEKAPALDVNSAEYKTAIVNHIKEGFHLKFHVEDKQGEKKVLYPLSLGRGRIKLSSHLSVLLFEIKGIPADTSTLEYKITSMSSGNVTNILRLIDGEEVKRLLLHTDNTFSGVDTFFSS